MGYCNNFILSNSLPQRPAQLLWVDVAKVKELGNIPLSPWLHRALW